MGRLPLKRLMAGARASKWGVFRVRRHLAAGGRLRVLWLFVPIALMWGTQGTLGQGLITFSGDFNPVPGPAAFQHGIRVLAVSQEAFQGSPVTATTRLAAGEGVEDRLTEIWLAGFAMANDQAALPLAVVWTKKESGWFPIWEMQWRAASGFLPNGLDAAEGDGQPLQPAGTFLGAIGPQQGHIYETSFSFDPQSGLVSAAVRDLTTGERLYASSGRVQPYQGVFYAGAGAMQAEAAVPPDAAGGTKAAPSPVASFESLRRERVFVPWGADWALLARNERTGAWNAPLPSRPQLDRATQKELAIRLAAPGSQADARFVFVADDGRSRRELLRVPAKAGEHVLPVKTADLPVGRSTLVLQYEAGDKAWTLDSSDLHVGKAHVAFGPVVPDGDVWKGKVTLTADGALPGANLRVGVTMAPLVWKGGSFQEQEGMEIPVVEATLAGIAEGPLTFTFRIPRPTADHARWRLQFQPVVSEEIPVAVTGEEAFLLLKPLRALYVATNGNDAWSGRLPEPTADGTDGPFAVLERARDEIRLVNKENLPTGGVTVFVRGGMYSLAQTFKLGAEDSGTPEAPIVYRAYLGENPTVIGGRQVSGFAPYQGEILKANAGAQGLAGVYFRQLFLDGKRLHLARYPNFDPANPYGGGWAYADGKPIPMYQNIPDEPRNRFQYKVQDARNWSRPLEGEVFVFPRYNWWNNIVRIQSIDRENRIMTLAGDASYPIRPTDRYYFRNLFEELDAPGEWYLDKETWTLYLWPPEGVDPAGMTVYAPTLRTILELGPGTSHVTFRGFTFEAAEGTAIVLNQTNDCLIAGNTIRNAGDYNGSGIAVNGGFRNGVVGNDIYEIGSHGISISGGDRITLTPAENYADNNYIHHVGVFYKQGVGISLSGAGNRASHNLIHDTPRMGIMFSGNNLVIEYNHIRHVNLETADTGAVYTGGRDWISSRGTVIRYNYFHDILGYGQENGRWVSPHYAWGIYLDDNAGGIDVIGNIAARAVRGLIHLHNGRDNRIENNIFVDGTLQQVEYNGWTKTHSYWLSHLPTMIQGYESVKDQPAWQGMRNMDTHPSEAVLPNGLIMTGNAFRRNIVYYRDPKAHLFKLRDVPFSHNEWDANVYWHRGRPVRLLVKGTAEESDWEAWQELGEDRHALVADPLFMDPEKDDYRLRPDSPALKLGFEPIPIEKIGPYQDERRASWPIVEAEGAREKPLVNEASSRG